MTGARPIIGAGVLVLEAGIAGLGVVVHFGLTAEYGDINDSAIEGTLAGFTTGVGVLALVLVAVVGLMAFALSPLRSLRVAAVLLPGAMVLGMLAVTPAALGQKLDVQYDVTPQCSSGEKATGGPSPYLRDARESQQAYESIEHVVLFGGGGSSGVGGCEVGFVATEDVDVDVDGHYRDALVEGGWRLLEQEGGHLRAERGEMAFELAVCGDGGVMWAGRRGSGGGGGCAGDGVASLPGEDEVADASRQAVHP
jgi:hypothetical protein